MERQQQNEPAGTCLYLYTLHLNLLYSSSAIVFQAVSPLKFILFFVA